MPSIIYTRLRDGSWGIKAQPDVVLEPGSTVTVEKKSGATKTEVVGTILSATDKGTIARVVRAGDAPAPAATPAPTPDTPLGKAQAAALTLLAAFEAGIVTEEAAQGIFSELLATVAPQAVAA